jgi:uncharacterized repeat protein (TIGR03803 family)
MKAPYFFCICLLLSLPLASQSTVDPGLSHSENLQLARHPSAPLSRVEYETNVFPSPLVKKHLRNEGIDYENVLYTFTGGNDGGLPASGLIFDESGTLYGTTAGGGSQACGGIGCGTIFELSPNPAGGWVETVLYTFTGGVDGWDPQSTLIRDGNGNLYGVAELGGSSTCTYTLGCGTVFELSPNGNGSWTEITLYSFVGGTDGQNPVASLTFDSQGNLYGTTVFGGTPSCYANVGCGTVFELTPAAGSGWIESVLYRFGGGAGVSPNGALIFDDSGNLYGTAVGGGIGYGVIFELSPSVGDAWTETVLHNFAGGSDGAYPYASLILNAGTFYGTTGQGGDANCNVGGGSPRGCGTVFELSSLNGTWQENVIYAFTGGQDGSYPQGGLTLYQSNLYGTTYEGGGDGCYSALGCGAVFELSPNFGNAWTENVLCGFNGIDGEYPNWGDLVIDESGDLYGTTQNGGSYGEGNVFQVTSSLLDGTTTTLASSVNPTDYGQAVNFTATVAAVSPGMGTPTGTVQFAIDGSAFGPSVTLASGSATSGSISTLTEGTHTVTATYSGSTSFLTSTGTLSGGQVVNAATAATVVTSSVNPSIFGQSVTFTATISGEYGLMKNRAKRGVKQKDVTGAVAWSTNTGCGTTNVTPGNPGVATCTTSSLWIGTDTITATYSGDSNHSGSTGNLSGQVVNQSPNVTASWPPPH